MPLDCPTLPSDDESRNLHQSCIRPNRQAESLNRLIPHDAFTQYPLASAKPSNRSICGIFQVLIMIFSFSGTSYLFPALRHTYTRSNHRIEAPHPQHITAHSQDKDQVFYHAGQIYWVRAEASQESNSILCSSSLPFMKQCHITQDIDIAKDWEHAKYMYKATKLQSEEHRP